MTVHWGLPDPAAVEGSEGERRQAFADTYQALRQRIGKFINLPIGGNDQAGLKAKLMEIGRG